jgi:DNA-binding response OmpR family regulator
MARVHAALRRWGGGSVPGQPLTFGDLAVDLENRRVILKGSEILLTTHEYKLLTLLMSYPAKLFTRDEIIEHIKGGAYEGFDRMVDTHVKNLRQKLGDDPRDPRYITTVYGMGYRFVGGV